MDAREFREDSKSALEKEPSQFELNTTNNRNEFSHCIRNILNRVLKLDRKLKFPELLDHLVEMTATRLYVPLDRGAGTRGSTIINVAELLKGNRNAKHEDAMELADVSEEQEVTGPYTGKATDGDVLYRVSILQLNKSSYQTPTCKRNRKGSVGGSIPSMTSATAGFMIQSSSIMMMTEPIWRGRQLEMKGTSDSLPLTETFNPFLMSRTGFLRPSARCSLILGF